MKVKIGIIGVGNIGTAHALTIYKNEIAGMELCALCDNDKARLNALAEEFPNIPTFENSEELIRSGLIDAVIIATPHYFHPTIALDALENNLHVVCEKPIGVYTYGMTELFSACEKSGKKACVMLNQRTNKLFKEAKRIIDAGELGEIKRSVWIITNWYRTQKYYNSGSWRATWSGEGGGVLMNQAPHNLDIWQWLCGMPKSIYAVCNTGKYHDIEVEDEATIYTEYENGASGVFIASTGDFPGTNRLEITGTRGRIILEKSTLTLQRFSCDEREYCRGECVDMSIKEQIICDKEYNGHKCILQNFTNSILYGEELISPLSDGLASLLICNGAYLSSWKNERISLPLDEAEYLELLKQRVNKSKKKQEGTHNLFEGTYKKRWNTNW